MSSSFASLVYFVEAPIVGRIKIGTTGLPIGQRMTALRTTSPVPLVLLGVQEGGTDMERVLHDRFADLRVHGEWFSGGPELRDYIERNAKSAEWAVGLRARYAVRIRLEAEEARRCAEARKRLRSTADPELLLWADRHTFAIKGETLTITDWAIRQDIDLGLLRSRLLAGWHPVRILFLDVDHNDPNPKIDKMCSAWSR